jgi:DNA-binding NtrC family response regulator
MHPKSPDPKQAHDKLKILVVEDSDILREIFRMALRDHETVFTAKGAKEGWKLYKEKSPDIVFMDIRLPDGNGHDLTKKIKEDNPATFVIMATVNDIVEEKEIAAHNHADGFITKPFNMREIDDCIERCLTLRARG